MVSDILARDGNVANLFLQCIPQIKGLDWICLFTLVEEDEEALKRELKEAFRIYDKECNG